MFTYRLAPAIASVGLGCGILLSAPFARDLYFGLQGAGHGPPSAKPARSTGRLSEGDLVARIAVARLDVDSPVLEGVAAGTLAQGAGHVPETALPGDENRNARSVIAVSRGRLGEAIGRLRLGDLVRLTTPSGPRGYRVVERRIQEPAQFRLSSMPDAHVTLLTPFPPESRGPAPMRLAVVLKLTD
jgi:sortase A